MRKLALLDLARALAAFWVLAAHLTILLGRQAGWLSEGRIPVDLFIFLSGFLMLHLLWHEQQGTDWRNVTRFYLRRFFRIAPCFYLAVLCYAGARGFYLNGLVHAEDHFGTSGSFSGYVLPLNKADLLAHVSFLHGLSQVKNTKVFGPAWTLSLEMQFYALAPFLVHGFKRAPVWTLLAAFVCNAACWWWFGAYGEPGHGGTHFFPSFLPDRLFLFCFGSAACLYCTERTPRNAWLLASSAIVSLVLFPLDSMALCTLLTVGLLLVLHAPQGPVRFVQRLAASRSVGWAAELSYSVYLIHQFCFALTAWLLWDRLASASATELGRWWFAAAAFAVTVTGAAVMFFLVERPARDWGKHLGSLLTAPSSGHAADVA